MNRFVVAKKVAQKNLFKSKIGRFNFVYDRYECKMCERDLSDTVGIKCLDCRNVICEKCFHNKGTSKCLFH